MVESDISMNMSDVEISLKGENEDLTELLRRFSMSLEETIDSIRIESLDFLCSKCCESMLLASFSTEENPIEKCDCWNGTELVEKRDCSIQTSPMSEILGTLPHIDSDEDGSYREQETYDTLVKTLSADATAPTNNRDLVQVKSISELPYQILCTGIQFPGTIDLTGRPLIVINKSVAAIEDSTENEIARVLLYLASLLKNDSDGEATVLLVSDSDSVANQKQSSIEDGFFFRLLDEAFNMVSKYLNLRVVVTWIPESWKRSGNYFQPQQKPYIFLRSGLECEFVTHDSLTDLVSPENLPRSCGGKAFHNPEEWINFFKETERVLNLCRGCGRRLKDFMADFCVPDTLKTECAASRIYQQQKAIVQVLADPDLEKLCGEGPNYLSESEKLAQSLSSNLLIRRHLQLAERTFRVVSQVVNQLRTLFEKRQRRIKEIIKLRALRDESSQVLSWISKKGEPGLKKHSELARNLQGIKKQEHDFEIFYFNGMKHLDKGHDLIEEGKRCLGEEEGRIESETIAGIRELTNSLKLGVKEFGERLENAREKLEDTCRCFRLLDKIYQETFETSNYVNRLKSEDCSSEEIAGQTARRNWQRKMPDCPFHTESHLAEVSVLIKKLNDDELTELFRVVEARHRETAETGGSQRTEKAESSEDLFTGPIPARKSSRGSESFVDYNSGRRKSFGPFPYIYKCNHHAEGNDCSCDPGFVRDPFEPEEEYQNRNPSPHRCDCLSTSKSKASKQIEENVENVSFEKCGNWECSVLQCYAKARQRRTCSWQHATEKFEDLASTNSSRSEESDVKDFEEQEGITGIFSVPTSATVNSHLYRHASDLSLDLASLTDGGEESKSRKTLLLITREMVQTERDYVASLEYVIENYIPELLREDIPQVLRGQRNVIFGNIEKIFEFHSRHFLQELTNNEKNPCSIGQCFLRHENKFYLYALYNKNKPKSDSLMTEYGSVFFKSKQVQLGDKMDLASYLLKPVQRMGKYALLLQQLMKASAPKDSSELAAAEAMVRFQLRHGNDLLAMDSLRECDVNLKEQGRLLRQNEFLVWQGKGKKCLRHVFLFEELILFSKARRFPDKKNLDIYIYKNSIKTTDIGLTAKIGDSPTKFEIWFRKRKPNDTFTLQSMSEEVKHEWIKELSALLWKQALRNREMRLQEMTSMGIGNKPCLDIRPSSDQISDRSVSATLLTKTVLKFRNSAGSVTQGFSASAKRPSSVVSVISSSSSSSTSSRGSIGSIFHAADSPTLPRSISHSRCSTESGIVPDIFMSEDVEGQGTAWHSEKCNRMVTSASLNSSFSPVRYQNETTSSSDNKSLQDGATEI